MPLDPSVKRFLDRLAAVNPPSALSLSIDQRRAALQHLLGFAASREPVGIVENRLVPGPNGMLRLRVYTPLAATATELPGLVFFHGGGLVAGSLDSHDPICRSLSNASGCRLIAVDYRLAPEHPFPAAIGDAYAATCAIARRAREFGIDAARLAVGGDSAGATLAAVVSQMAAASGEPPLALQVLLCPIMDFGAQTGSRRDFAAGYFVDQATLEHDLRHYLGSEGDPTDPRVSPLRAGELGALPPACIHTAEFDPLRDEGAAYAERLRGAGVRTHYHCHPGMIHLFYGMGALVPYAAKAYECIGADIRSLLGMSRTSELKRP